MATDEMEIDLEEFDQGADLDDEFESYSAEDVDEH
jgi:hypothetical protein